MTTPPLEPIELTQPTLPPLTLCGGLVAPYRIERALLAWESQSESVPLAPLPYSGKLSEAPTT